MKDAPEVLNKIADVVLAYKPKPKTKAARKRKKLSKAKEKEAKTRRLGGLIVGVMSMTADEVEKRLSLPVNPEVLSEIYDFGTNMQKEAVERIKSIESKATALAAYGTAIISILVSSSSGWLSKADLFSVWIAVVAAFCALASTAVSVQALTLRKLLTISEDEWLSQESFGDVQLLKKVWIRSLWYVLTRYATVQERQGCKGAESPSMAHRIRGLPIIFPSSRRCCVQLRSSAWA